MFEQPKPRPIPRPALTPTRADPSVIASSLRSAGGGFTSLISGATALARKGKTLKRSLIGGA